MIQWLHVIKLYKFYKYGKEIKTIPTDFNEKKVTCKTQITIALLIAVSIHGYMIKYQTKHLLPFYGIKSNNNKKNLF